MPRPPIILAILFLFAFCARAQEPAWQPVGLSGGGAMFNPVISPADPKVAIVHCDMSGVYLTHDGGASWRMIDTAQLRSNTRCRAAFGPTDPNIIYSPHNDSTLKISRDGGAHWEKLAEFDDELAGPITIDPQQPATMLVGVGTTTQLSADGAKTWRACQGIDGAFVGAHFAHGIAGSSHIFVATGQGIWQSDDGGANWRDFSQGLPFKTIRCLTGGTKDGHTILYCTIPGEAHNGHYVGGIYASHDGQPWQPANGPGLNLDITAHDEWADGPICQYHDIATTDENPNVVWATNENTGVPPPHQCSVYRSDDAGKTWRATFYPDPRYKGFNVAKDYTVVEDHQFYQQCGQITVDPHHPEHVLQIMGGECYFTTDGGKSWACGHTQPVGTPQPGGAWRCTGLVVTTTWHYYIDPHEPNRHYICYTDLGFARSLDAGQSWIWWSRQGRSPWANTCYELAFDPDIPGKIWGAFSDVHDIPNANIIFNRHNSNGPGGICASNDFAATWNPLTGLPKAPATAIVLDPKSAKGKRTLYAGFFGQGVYKSTDDGQTWAARNAGLGDPTNMRVCRVEIHPDGTLFALITALVTGRTFQSRGVGLYRSTNGGDSWQCITQTAPCLWPKDFTVDPADSRIIYLGLCDANHKPIGGLYRTTNGGTSWQLLTRQGPEHFGAYLPPKHPGWIYATLTEDAPNYGLYLSKDDGKSFHPLTGLLFDNAMRITFDPANDNIIYVSTFGGSVWRGPAD